ncbi:MAG TPA: FG-GAP-like repeat-containing protein [Verrucomicrobiae bacterium]|nr:FG-GAP-like repeat-containing protein [Verrucomicrobiae bacterium]
MAHRSAKPLVAGLASIIVLAALFLFLRHRSGESDQFVQVMNAGKAYLDNNEAAKAIETFQKAVALDGSQPDAHLNLANSYLLAGQAEEALKEAGEALRLDPGSAAALYVAGCANLRLARYDLAVQALQQAKDIDRTVNAAAFQLGRAHQQLGHFDEAREQFEEIAQFETNTNSPIYSAAYYNLGQVLLRLGRQDDAKQALDEYQKMSASKGPQPNDPSVFERCVYTAARAPFVLELPDPKGVKVTFSDATAAMLGAAAKNYRGPVGVLSINGRGTNDLFVLEPGKGFRVLFNNGAAFEPRGEPLPATNDAGYRRCLVADLDNDRYEDVIVLGEKASHVFKFATNGVARDITRFAGLSDLTGEDAVVMDLSLTAKLDLLALTTGTNSIRAFRNYGSLFSSKGATSAPPATITSLSQLVIEDWNNDDLADLLATRPGQPPLLFLRQRGGPLVQTNAPPDWPAGDVIVTGDLNNDLHPDLVVATSDHLELVFTAQTAHVNLPLAGNKVTQLQLLDYDNDGWLDIIAVGDRLQIWRNMGKGQFAESTQALGLDKLAATKIDFLAAADFDNDGDTDLLIAPASGGLVILRNDGGNANHQLKLRLLGTRSNGSGIGVRIDYTANGMRGSRFVRSLPVEIGTGPHDLLNSLNIHWSDLYPAIFDVPVKSTAQLPLVELRNPTGSCPYLYAWDGHRFRFVTDILGAAPVGLPVAEGKYIDAKPEEYVWIGNEQQFPPRDGNHIIQLTEELREMLYLDEAALVVVDHPAGTEAHPTDKLLPGKPFPPGAILTLQNRRPLLHAERLDGTDVTSVLEETDGKLVSPKTREPQLRGLAEPHGVVLDFGPLPAGRPLVLALTGWLQFGGGMANIAASLDDSLPFPFPVLEVEGGDHRWQPVDVTVGAPAGKTKTILVDLAGKLPPDSRRLRLRAAFEIHWDRAALFERADDSATKIARISPDRTDLHWRGFSEFEDRPVTDPLTPDYNRVRQNPLWRVSLTGWCTRYGEVNGLLAKRDEGMVLINGGDELTLKFAANRLPPKPEGFVRDFFLYADGWDKDADPHVKLGWQVEPLPWHGMNDQLYGNEARPKFASDEMMRRYNTRWSGPLALDRKNQPRHARK